MFEQGEINELLFGQGTAIRFTQDSPVLPDVWRAFATDPGRQVDLLLVPARTAASADVTPSRLAQALSQRLGDTARSRCPTFPRAADAARPSGIAHNLTTVAVRLYFDELIRAVLPMSLWWQESIALGFGIISDDLQQPAVQRQLAVALVQPERDYVITSDIYRATIGPLHLWMLRVAGTIALAHEVTHDKRSPATRRRAIAAHVWPPPRLDDAGRPGAGHEAAGIADATGAEIATEDRFQPLVDYYAGVVRAAAALFAGGLPSDGAQPETTLPRVGQISLNRSASLSIWRSSRAVKADAVARVFGISCRSIAWAILDDGIDATHIAFRKRADQDRAGEPLPLDGGGQPGRQTRVAATYDFTRFRDLLSADTADWRRLPAHVRDRLVSQPDLARSLREDLLRGRTLDWSLVTPLIEIPHTDYVPPKTSHGTHVAGILGADWRAGDRCPKGEHAVFPLTDDNLPVAGICPDIVLYDLRVIDPAGRGDEFSVMAALQFVRHLNAQSRQMLVHGVNMSLAISHDVANYACGSTPVCEECSRLLGDGVVVVAAAGNEGYERPTGLGPALSQYRSISITDPGNAERVITVGATHRTSPHTYGVSYFSSRGPTGDGRLKPDLVAPGEKIESCLIGNRCGRMDGTSMAAPHVSGAAALLMARYPELIGRPDHIKDVLCRSATDLGRERYFQGHGMLDILRALQSV